MNVGFKAACLAVGIATAWGAEECDALQYVPPGNPVDLTFSGSVTSSVPLTHVRFLYTSNASYLNSAAPSLPDISANTPASISASARTRDEFLSLGRNGFLSIIGVYQTGNPDAPEGVALGMLPAWADANAGAITWNDLFTLPGGTEDDPHYPLFSEPDLISWLEADESEFPETQSVLAGFLHDAAYDRTFPSQPHVYYPSAGSFVSIDPEVFENASTLGSPPPLSFDMTLVSFSTAQIIGSASGTVNAVAVPEPSSLLGGSGFAVLTLLRRPRARR